MKNKATRREELLRQIIPLFNEHGYWKIRVDDIAESLKISKKTLYIEFENKKDIIKNVIDLRVEKMQSSANRIEEAQMDAVTAFLNILSDFYHNIDISQDKLNFSILKKYYNELYDYQIEEIYKAIFNVISVNYERGKKEGLYRDEFSGEFIGSLWADSFLNNRIGKYITHSPEMLQKQKQNTIKLLFLGMTTDQGRKVLEEKLPDYPI